MHKQLVNQCTIHLSLIPQGPILIKSGRQGADPTKADMEFVETYYQGEKSIYLPGSSLKGAIRAHAERIVRTVGGSSNTESTLWANDSTGQDNRHIPKKKADGCTNADGIDIYKASSFTEQMFGNTSLASRIRFEDAYSDEPVVIEERNGVAIDRVLGAATGGQLFNYQVCTSGKFSTSIHLRNFSLAQLGLLGLVLRDLNEGWFAIGFGKSRGLGNVAVEYHSAIVQYPGCELRKDKKIYPFGKQQMTPWESNQLLGAGEFLDRNSNEYQFPRPDKRATNYDDTVVHTRASSFGFGVELCWQESQVKNLFAIAVASWREVVQTQTQPERRAVR